MAATVVYARSRPRIAYVEEWRALDLFGDSRLVPAMRHRSHPPSLDRRAVTRHQMSHQTAASPVSRSVPGFKRDDDVRCFRLVKLETTRVVVAPAGKIHDLGRRPGGGLGRLHDIEPLAVEEERVFPEQVVELWNHRVVVGNGLGFELAQSSLELCGVEFHCTLLSVRSKAMRRPISRVAGPPTSAHFRWSNATLSHPAWPR